MLHFLVVSILAIKLAICANFPLPIGFWPLNDVFGLRDISGSGNDLNWVSSSTEPVYSESNAIKLLGANNDQYLSVTDSIFDMTNRSFTISFVYQSGNFTGKVFEYGSTGGFNFQISNAGLFCVRGFETILGPCENAGEPLTVQIPSLDWYFVVFSYSADSTVANLCSARVPAFPVDATTISSNCVTANVVAPTMSPTTLNIGYILFCVSLFKCGQVSPQIDLSV